MTTVCVAVYGRCYANSIKLIWNTGKVKIKLTLCCEWCSTTATAYSLKTSAHCWYYSCIEMLMAAAHFWNVSRHYRLLLLVLVLCFLLLLPCSTTTFAVVHHRHCMCFKQVCICQISYGTWVIFLLCQELCSCIIFGFIKHCIKLIFLW